MVFNASRDIIFSVSILLIVKIFASFFPILLTAFSNTLSYQSWSSSSWYSQRGNQHLPRRRSMQQWSRMTVRIYHSIAYSDVRFSSVVTKYRDNNDRRTWCFIRIHHVQTTDHTTSGASTELLHACSQTGFFRRQYTHVQDIDQKGADNKPENSGRGLEEGLVLFNLHFLVNTVHKLNWLTIQTQGTQSYNEFSP